jgi:hypothetical protein
MSDKNKFNDEEVLQKRLNEVRDMLAELMADNLTGKGVSALRLAMVFNKANGK